MSRLTVDTSLAVAGVYMFVTGIGIGLVMQVLVLATQNAVEQKDLGVATSGATFFRSLGGALGVAVFGALLTHRLADTIPSRLAEAGVPVDRLAGGTPTLGSPEQIGALPEPVHAAVITGFADALQTTFLAAVPFALLGSSCCCSCGRPRCAGTRRSTPPGRTSQRPSRRRSIRTAISGMARTMPDAGALPTPADRPVRDFRRPSHSGLCRR